MTSWVVDNGFLQLPNSEVSINILLIADIRVVNVDSISEPKWSIQLVLTPGTTHLINKYDTYDDAFNDMLSLLFYLD